MDSGANARLVRVSVRVSVRVRVGVRVRLGLPNPSPNPNPNRVAEEVRRKSVEQNGWHAPLNRRYQALGPPHLDLGRKPDWGEWAARKPGATGGAPGEVDGEKNIFVGHG